MDFETEKIVNRFAESTGQKFTKIPDELIIQEKILKTLQHELDLENSKVKKDTFAIDIINARLIAHKRQMTALKKKHKIK